MCHLRLIFPYRFSVWMSCLELSMGFLHPQLWQRFCQFLPLVVSSCFIQYFGAPWLGVYVLRSVMSSWCSVLFIIIKCPSLFLVTFDILRSILSDIGIAIPPFLWMLFSLRIIFLPFTLSLSLSLQLKCVSWREHMIGFVLWSNLPCCAFILVNSVHLHLG